MKNFKNNFIVKFVVALFLIGVIIGFLFYFFYKPDLAAYLESFKSLLQTSHQNTFLSSIVVVSMIFISSISLIGLPILSFYLFYEGLSIGFTLGLFLGVYSVKGLFFYIVFLFTSKLLFLLIVLYFSIVSIRYSLKFVDAILSKSRENLYSTIVYQFYRYLLVLLAVLINSTIVFFAANKIALLLINLI